MTLLVLANLGHLDAAALDVAALLAAAPALTVVTTSRAPIRIAAEHEFEVPPLPLPGGSVEFAGGDAREDAVALFVVRARAVRADFALTEANASAFAEICARLDGLPLALELAAARIKLFSPQAMLDHLVEHPLELLARGR